MSRSVWVYTGYDVSASPIPLLRSAPLLPMCPHPPTPHPSSSLLRSVDSIRFKDTYEDVFTAPSLQSRWYVIAGNHDHYGNVSAEIAYTQKSQRWYFPSEYYTEVMPIPGSNQTVQFIFLDTIVLCGHSDDRVSADIIPHATDEAKAASNAQLAWLEATLANSTADWIIAAGHYPIYSVAEHGPTAFMVQNVKPLFEKYKVAAYMNGHDHSMQHIQPSGSPVDYFVIGAANFAEDSKKHAKDVPAGSEKYFWPPHILDGYGAFASVALNATTLSVTYIETGGKVLYSTSKSNPRAQ
eukprot:TRINITY_DN1238_c0_g1_i1.p1 TRINITY_DN1238_c0_g1~~TRINITY_DN1238_c0_g1_i1.p1  ORF type:complete len:296 (-),score=74.61 TRINITY_DN1238_c0_g1_i1:14-901(-)